MTTHAVDSWGRLPTARPGPMSAPGPLVPPMPEVRRSSRWPGVLHAFLAAHPLCLGTGLPAETAHHVVPFHDDHALELDPANLVPVRVWVHFAVCHLGDWRITNPRCREHLAAYRKWYDAVRGR